MRFAKRFSGSQLVGLAKIVHTQAAPFDDAFERAYRNGLITVHRHNYLPAADMAPFLVAALLADHHETVPAKDSNNFLGAADWKSFAQGSAISSTFAPAGTETGDGSNQSSRASFALRTASSSVSPADAQPGSSGKNAAQRLVSGSCSTTSRSFIPQTIVALRPPGNPQPRANLACAQIVLWKPSPKVPRAGRGDHARLASSRGWQAVSTLNYSARHSPALRDDGGSLLLHPLSLSAS